jgi:transposase
MRNKLTLINFNRNVQSLQLSINFDVDAAIPEDGKVRLVCNIVERMNLSTVLSAYSPKGKKPVLDPITFLKVLLFCYSEGIFHSRKIENFCKYDLRGHFILGG